MKDFLKTESLAFDDVHIVPQYSTIRSRKEVNLSVRLKNSDVVMGAPIFASPMDTVSGPDMASAIWKEIGGVAIIHRYCSIMKQVEMVSTSIDKGAVVGAAVGIKDDYLERADSLVKAGAEVLCIDVAHGHHIMMKESLSNLRRKFPATHIMAGNVATREGFKALADWGADSIRVGIGSGSICSTRTQTGHGFPLLQSLIEVSDLSDKAQIIADGGLVYNGDIVKALGAGATFVMTGRLLAGTDETPGEIIDTEQGKFKSYRGMSSKESQIEWRGISSSNEGVATKIPYRGSVKPVLEDIVGSVRSGLSYSGSRTVKEFQEKVVFAKVSHASSVEATPHILSR